MDEETQKEEVVVDSEEKLIADDKAVGIADEGVDGIEEKLIIADEVTDIEKKLTLDVEEEVAEFENQIETEDTHHESEEDKTNFELSPEEEIQPESSHTIKPTPDTKID
ncbi:unnamed protein product, partial [Larinioides sclopetarius]